MLAIEVRPYNAPVRVSDIGEFGLIERIRSIVSAAQEGMAMPKTEGPRLLLGIGDDAAAWTATGGVELQTTDTLVDGVHFTFATATPQELGWKAMAVNLSDIAAMGGTPHYTLVTLGLPPDTEVQWVDGLYNGMLEAGREYSCAIVGGDIVRSPVIFVTLALHGTIPAGQRLEPMTRSAARPGDALAVTGWLGTSAGGLRLLTHPEAMQGLGTLASTLREAHLHPRPRLAEGQRLASAGVRACIDISDGLVDDAGKLCQSSGVEAVIQADRVPVQAILKTACPTDWLALALSGGEDYELLVSGPRELLEGVGRSLAVPLTVIGEVKAGTPGKVAVLDSRGNPIPLSRGGWDHLR